MRVNSQQRVGQAVGQGVAAVAAMQTYLDDAVDDWSKILVNEASQDPLAAADASGRYEAPGDGSST
ncbi:hypothetical protein GCM10018779_10390 [Streptomyces griseocarneus]|nr:hypothetical protein GCM10018779_10390 [Streptomyces griseocarneus]